MTLTTKLSPIPANWASDPGNMTTDTSLMPFSWPAGNIIIVTHVMTANIAPTALGGLWRGAAISAEDIQASRREMWTNLEAGE